MGDLHERTRWEALWQETVWEWHDGHDWHPLPDSAGISSVAVSAWNPVGRRLPIAVNVARDAVLIAELQALGLGPARARGRSPDGRWWEDGWLIPHLPARTSSVLRRYGQIAGLVMGPDGRHYHWAADQPAT